MVSNAAITPHRSFMNTSSTLSTEFTYDGLLRLGGATTTISETPYANGDPVEGNVNFDTYGGTMYSVETSYASAGRLANKTSNPESSVTPLVNNELDYSLAYNYNPAKPHQIQTVTESYQGSLVSNQFTYNSSGSITNIARTGTGIPNGNIEMLWNEEQWMVADENNNGVHHYVYDYTGERIMKSSYSQTVLWQNENEAGSTGTLDAYTVYVNPYLVLNSYQNNEILYFKKTLHYYVGAERVASGEFSKFLQESPGEGGEEGRGPAKTSPLASSGSDASLEEGIISDNEALNNQSPNLSNQVLDQLEEILTHFGYEEGKDFTRETLEKPVPLSTIYPEFVSTSTSSASKQSGSFEIEVEAQPFAAANGSTIVEVCEGLASEVYWYHNNYLGNVDLVTNTSGEVHQFFLYNAWGENMHEYNPVTPGFDSPYRFNAKELDKETGLAYYGARYYQNKFSIWLSVDPLASKYPSMSPYVYTGNCPTNAVDPDGRYIIFIGGLRLLHGARDQAGHEYNGMGGKTGIYTDDVFRYWRTYNGATNAFGREVDLVQYYSNKYKDNKVGFTSGSSFWTSQASSRKLDGVAKAKMFHQMVESGEIVLDAGETIKIISHSQGGAHATGYAEQLMSYKNEDGTSVYNVEVIEYITPHQPTDITHPAGILGIQYSHQNDAVAGDDSPWWMPNGGTKHGPIIGITLFFEGNIMGGENQPPANGNVTLYPLAIFPASGNRNGHSVTDNDEFIKQGEL